MKRDFTTSTRRACPERLHAIRTVSRFSGRMRQDVMEDRWKASLLTWVKSFNN